MVNKIIKNITWVGGILLALGVSRQALAATCVETGFFRDSINMTAALIDPSGTVSVEVDATGCNIGIYYGPNVSGKIDGANIHGANYFGVVVNGDAGSSSVDILNSNIHDIGEMPHNGSQHGIAIYYRGFLADSHVQGTVRNNTISAYQKGGIVVNGIGVRRVDVVKNTITGDGHITFIAQNGIQIGYGARASVKQNTVTGNSYIGTGGWASGGIIVVGGAGYGTCPDGNDCPLTVLTQIDGNIVANNDVGVYLSNADSGFVAPSSATNIKVINNQISDDQCYSTAA